MSREAPPVDPALAAPPASNPEEGSGPASPPTTSPPASPPAAEADDGFYTRLKGMSAEDWEKLPEDEFSRIPWVERRLNAATSRHIERVNRESQQALQQQQQQIRELTRIDARWAELEQQARAGNPEGLMQNLADPGLADQYARVQKWRQDGKQEGVQNQTQLLDRVAQDMIQGLVNYLKDTEEWSHLSESTLADIFAEKDPKRILSRILETGNERSRKDLEAKAKAAAEARYNDLLARRGLSATEPEPPHGAVIGSGAGELTLESYGSMSSAERRELQRTNPAAIDSMMAALQDAAIGAGAT